MTKEAAIQFIEEARDIHLKWAAFLRADETYPTDDVGDIDHHEEWVQKYNVVLEVLR